MTSPMGREGSRSPLRDLRGMERSLNSMLDGPPPRALSSSARRGDVGSLVVDDLLQGMNEWRNIQDVIRSTFKALHDVIKAQGDAVKSLERQLEGKASNADVQAALQRKANISDVNRSLTDITHALEGKASVYDVEQKPDRSEVQIALKGKASVIEMTAELALKADRDDVEALRAQLERHLNAMANQLDEHAASIDRRPSRDETMLLLSQKVDLAPFEERFGLSLNNLTVAQVVAKKADQYALDEVHAKVCEHIEDLRQMHEELKRSHINAKEEQHDKLVDHHKKAISRVDAVQEHHKSLAQQHAELSAKLENLVREMAQLMSEHQTAIRVSTQEVHALVRTTAEEAHRELTKTEVKLRETEGKLRGEMTSSLTDVRAAMETKIGADCEAVRKQVERVLDTSLEQFEELLGQTARRDDVVKALAAKADKAELEDRVAQTNRQLKTQTEAATQHLADLRSQKVDAATFDKKFRALDDGLSNQELALQRVADLLNTSAAEAARDIRRLDAELEARAEKIETFRRLEGCITEITDLEKEVRRKADIKDVNLLIDGKADVDEINRALLDVNGQLNLKASMADISATLHEQALLNSTLITELCLGRWIWKSLKTKAGGAVPWNIQTANSDPANLMWEKDKSYVTCVAPGLYEIQLGFFSRRKPVVKLHVNGEPVLTLAGPSASVQHHAGGRLQSSGRYTNSNITGLTHIDFIALPSRARVSCSYQGDDDAEAFLGLRKL